MNKKYSYVSLLTNDSYVYGIILLAESLKTVNTKYPLHLLVTPNVSKVILEILNQINNVTYEIVDIISTPDDIYEYNKTIKKEFAITWKNCWTKFRIFNLIQFDKIVFLDADIMILKNLDHLFEKPHMTAAVDGEYFNIWPNDIHFNAGCLVIEPKKGISDKILEFTKTLNTKDFPNKILADQEILNAYYKDWPIQTNLHLNKYYNIFGPYIQEDQIQDITDNAYFIHFIGRKPWAFWSKNPAEVYSEHFYQLAKKRLEIALTQFDWAKIRSMLVITVYAICKDERSNVDRWLNSFSRATHVCVLDTGSTDGTWEYLQEQQKKYPNLILDQKEIKPWRYDKARDASMLLIPKDTDIFFMADLDEEIRESDWPDKVRAAWDPLFSRMMYDYHRDLDEQGNIIRTIKEYRIHSKAWTHWVNIVHEAICTEAGEKRFYMESCNPVDIEVWHYAKSRENHYAELCEEDLKEKPNDWIMRLQLAIEYELKEEYDKAEFHYSYLLSHITDLQSFEVARCFNGMARQANRAGEKRLAEQYYTEGRLVCDFFADNYIEAMELYYNANLYYKVIELGKVAIEKCIEAQWCSNYDIRNYYIYYIMGLTYWALNKPIQAIGYMQYAYERTPNDEIKKLVHNFCEEISTKIESAKVNFEL